MAAGELASIHVRRLRRIPADAIAAYITRQLLPSTTVRRGSTDNPE